MDIIVRIAAAKDFPFIVSLIHEFADFQKTPGKVKITADQMMEDEALFQCYVAESGSAIVGFATFFFAYYSWSGKALYLDDLYVKAQYRKHGIGKKLLMSVIDLAKKSNCKKLRWQVSKWNDTAINFYKSIGAEVDDIEINCNYNLI